MSLCVSMVFSLRFYTPIHASDILKTLFYVDFH